MRIGRIINNLQEKFRIRKLVKHDNKLNSLVTIHDNGFNRGEMQKVYEAQEVLANYAEQKGIHIDVFDRLSGEEALKHEGDIVPSNDVFLKVTDNLSGANKIEPIKADHPRIKTFLRALYEGLENLTNGIKKEH